MQVWIASVIIIFALSQFWTWLQGLEYSSPVLALGGLLLALISNYDKRASLPFWPQKTQLKTAEIANLPPQTSSLGSLPHEPVTQTLSPGILSPRNHSILES